jgi:hypothetical protein
MLGANVARDAAGKRTDDIGLEIMWPPLPKTGFISGRTASEKDIGDGNAAFVIRSKECGIVGRPIPIDIPQYAFHIDERGTRTPCILIQAETDGVKLLAAAQYFDGTSCVHMLWEFVLLGHIPPTESM